MEEQNNNEVLTVESTAPQNHSAEATQVVSDTTNYTPDEQISQPIDEAAEVSAPTKDYFIIDDTERDTLDEQYDFKDGNKIQSYNVAKCIVDKFRVIRLQDILYIYDESDNIYINDTKVLEHIIIQLVPTIKLSDIKSVLYDLGRCAPEREQSDYQYVSFNNCVVNVDTLEIVDDYDPDRYIITTKVFADYVPEVLESNNSNVEFVRSFFKELSCDNSELTTLYLEILGYSLVRTSKFELGFILKGSANNGKSTFLDVLSALLGKYCAHENLARLYKDKSLLSLYNCTANIVDDIQHPKSIDLARLQSIISGAEFEIERTGDSKFKFRPFSTLLVATTYMLQFKDFNRSLIRRFKVIPFPANFDQRSDVNMKSEICKSSNLDIIATLAIQAFHKVLTDKKFHIPDYVEQDTLNYFFEGNSAIAFVITNPINMLVDKGYYYGMYTLWCNRNNMTEVGANVFGKVVLMLGYLPDRLTFDGIRGNYYKVADCTKNKMESQYHEYCDSLADGETPMTISRYIDSLNALNKLNI